MELASMGRKAIRLDRPKALSEHGGARCEHDLGLAESFGMTEGRGVANWKTKEERCSLITKRGV